MCSPKEANYFRCPQYIPTQPRFEFKPSAQWGVIKSYRVFLCKQEWEKKKGGNQPRKEAPNDKQNVPTCESTPIFPVYPNISVFRLNIQGVKQRNNACDQLLTQILNRKDHVWTGWRKKPEHAKFVAQLKMHNSWSAITQNETGIRITSNFIGRIITPKFHCLGFALLQLKRLQSHIDTYRQPQTFKCALNKT